ncbi:hypothetical protein COCCADRAFT_28536 [Bipolaris zeicola 26-R-13]|uniref:Uncharacterized protein n=1 Tax=Cochliobolus carbonum (strain 26-R-13) TaxID=930089 RepID=W6Y5Y4_COCC2|nr:uncharacterized protein COCCADRAFT_28536 [Bipolaris zeicola 26-R-13]EUC30614.1 hypothetical protein COCCADRAFT_28536 [Bipolaris zeicola 26-R-13]
MASPSTTKSTPAVASSSSSLHPRLTFRDWLRFALFLFIPLYARFYISPSLSSLLGHIYVIGTTGISIVHFRGDVVGLSHVADVAYGVAISSAPRLGRLYSYTARMIPNIEGWRGEVLDWAFIARSVMYILPEMYGKDVKKLNEEYTHAYPGFPVCVLSCCVPIVWCCFGGRGYSWYNLFFTWSVLSHFFEDVYLICLNYRSLCRSGKTVREDSWPHKDATKKPGRWMNGHGRELTLGEVIQWHSTGSITPKT